MAEAIQANKGGLMECPVCIDHFKDARTLFCGHHFCRGCLEKISEDSGVIVCPTCQYQTDRPVASLKKFKLNEFEAGADMFMDISASAVDKLCNLCESAMSDSTCMECKVTFCKNCQKDHANLEKVSAHKCQPISPFHFCKPHQNVIISFCTDCRSGCCFKCLRDHKSHKLSNLEDAATNARSLLNDQIYNMDPIDKDQDILDRIISKRTLLEDLHVKFREKVGNIRQKLEASLETLDTVNKATEQQIKAELKSVSYVEWDISNFVKTKEKYIKALDDLNEEEADVEVIFRQDDLPKYTSSSCESYLDKTHIQFPVLQNLHVFEQNLEKYKHLLAVEFTRECLNPYGPMENLERDRNFSIPRVAVTGMIFNTITNNLAVRTNLLDKPLQIYDQDGKLVGILGKDMAGVSDYGIGFDSRRGLYIVPSNDTKIIIVPDERYPRGLVEEFNIPDCTFLANVSYCEEEDQYVISDAQDAYFLVIDAQNKTMSYSIQCKNKPDRPYHVLCTRDEGSESPVIITSCHGDNTIRKYNQVGHYLHNYCTEEVTVSQPRGICIDPSGRILVCDCGNHRIVAFWTEHDEKRGAVLISTEKLGKENPQHLAIDRKNRLLYVGFYDGTIYRFAEHL